MENLQETILRESAEKLHAEFDKILLEGIKRKGFEFKTRNETLNFIKERCHAITDQNQTQTFFIDDNPFLIYDKSIKLSAIKELGDKITIKATSGKYTFV